MDRLVGAICLNVFLDPIGRAAQRELAQRHQVALAEEVARCALDLFGKIDLAGLEPRQQLVGRDVDQNDIVGVVEKRVGDGFPYADAGDAADDVVQALQMLDVERRENVDAAGQQLVDVLPALRMPRTRRVGVRQLVDQDQCGATCERRVEVEFGDRCSLDVELEQWQALESLEQRGRLRPPVRLQDADDHVGPGAAQRLGRDQHRVGLADAGRGAEEDLQPPAGGARFLRFEFGEKLIGIRALLRHA